MSRLPIGITSILFCRLSALAFGAGFSLELVPPVLSTHQRIVARAVIDTQRSEPASALVELRGGPAQVWQHRVTVTGQGTASAFVLPGDYVLSVTIAGVTRTRKLHVKPLKSDPLPDAWKNLPAVEFITAPPQGAPDLWFLPEVKSRLDLPVPAKRPVHVELLVNTTPSERAAGSLAALRRNMSLLIPALKILTGMNLEGGTIDAALLDLTHRKVAYEQHDIHELNWTSMRRFFLETNPGMIDVHALENEHRMREFFADEIARRMAAADDKPVIIIVLSGPAFFESQEPFNLAVAGDTSDRRLIYIRDRFVNMTPRLGRPGFRPNLPRPVNLLMPVDDLEKAIEPLHPHIYDAANGEQFRRILAAVLARIAAM